MEYMVLFLLSLVAISAGQSKPRLLEWDATSFPDPAKDPVACGRYAKKPAYVCDPNGILPAKGADILDWLLEGVYMNDTKCPCSAYQCEQANVRSKGYIINVAVVKKLRKPASQNTKEGKINAAFQFANDLEKTKWDKGTCDNDVVIVFSADDQTVYTIAGRTAGLKLSEDVVSDITNNHLSYFDEGTKAYHGLYGMIVDYRNVLRGDYISWRDRDKSQEPIGASSRPVVSVSILLTVAIALLFS